MTREEHLTFCKKCTHRKMDMQQGLLCDITHKKADFEESCDNFYRDQTVADDIADAEPKSAFEAISELPEGAKALFAEHQNLTYGIVGSFFLSILCALIWAVITVSTEYQIGYMAIGVGFAVGMGMRFFGAGISPIYGYLGGFFALLGCALGNLFSSVGFIANEQSLGYLQTLMLLDFNDIVMIYEESFSPMDLLFYGIAVFEGYKFSFRPIPVDYAKLQDFTPQGAKLRLPIVVACFALLAIAGFTLSSGVNQTQEYTYPNGNIQARGELVNGRENGEWKTYYESGAQSATMNFLDGLEEGPYAYFSEEGSIMTKGAYKNGLMDGTWQNYNAQGSVVAKYNYNLGRLDGSFETFYDDGSPLQIGQYSRDKQDGEWKTYNEDGSLNATGLFKTGELVGPWKFWDEAGNPIQEVNYLEDGNLRIVSIWDADGNKTVDNGNGTFVSYWEGNTLSQEGKVLNGMRVGTWTSYYEDGKTHEIGEYLNDKYILKTAYNRDGEEIVKDGYGQYYLLAANSELVIVRGSYKNGLRTGVWETYYPNSTQMQRQENYISGTLHGKNISYFEDGTVMTDGRFLNDKMEGEWIWYHESGVMECSATYISDRKQGEQIFLNESGVEVKKEVYEDGELISEELL